LFTPGSATVGRDKFYEFVFSLIADTDMIQAAISGVGAAMPHRRMSVGSAWDDYTCDPAQEQQGLNSVFAVDKSTLDIISKMTKRIKQ